MKKYRIRKVERLNGDIEYLVQRKDEYLSDDWDRYFLENAFCIVFFMILYPFYILNLNMFWEDVDYYKTLKSALSDKQYRDLKEADKKQRRIKSIKTIK